MNKDEIYEEFTYKPCKEAMDFLVSCDDMTEAWNKVKRADWMRWALEMSVKKYPSKEEQNELVEAMRIKLLEAGEGFDAWSINQYAKYRQFMHFFIGFPIEVYADVIGSEECCNLIRKYITNPWR